MIVYDCRGIPQTVSSINELERIDKSLIGMLGMEYDPSEFFARNEDESGSLALLEIDCVNLISSMEHDKLLRAKELIKPYRGKGNQWALSDRDFLLLDAIEKWTDKKYKEAYEHFSHILLKYPTDILTILASHMLEFYMGWTVQMLKTIQNGLPAWKKDDPLYGYLKGMEAFCLEENGFYEESLKVAEEALQINKRNIYVIHAICHYFYETGQYEQGVQWMENCSSYWKDNLFMRIHVWWHYALFNLYALDLDHVYQIYHSEIRRKNDPQRLEDLDAVSLLWRLRLIGKDDPLLWKDLLHHWKDYPDNNFYWFNDMHALLVYLANGEKETADRLIIQSVNKNCDEYRRKLVNHAFEGFKHFSEGRYRQAYAALEQVVKTNAAFGGSNAQRDLLEMTAIEAALRANDLVKTESFIRNGRCLKYNSPLKQYYMQRIKNPDLFNF